MLRDEVIDRIKASGVGIFADAEFGQELLDRENGKDVRLMSFGEPYNFEQYPLGRVEPNLADKTVEVVNASSQHGFANYKEAYDWGTKNLCKTYTPEETGGKGFVEISPKIIGKYVSKDARNASSNEDLHYAVLKVIPQIIKNGIDVETHPNFAKKNGKRIPENGHDKNVLVHRVYAAVSVDGQLCRVKITMKENLQDNALANKPYSYEVEDISTKIESLEPIGDKVNENQVGISNNSITTAKLLNGVEMSYNPGVKVLDESEKRSEKIRYLIVRKGDLTRKELDTLIEHIDKSLEAVPNMSTDEVYGLIRQVAEMNHNAYKGYGRLTDYEANVNSRIYTLKGKSLDVLVPELLKRGEHVGYNGAEGIVYFRDERGSQISFHGYDAPNAIENKLDRDVEWDGKTEAWRNDEDFNVKSQRESMRQQIIDERRRLNIECESSKDKALEEHFGYPWYFIGDTSARIVGWPINKDFSSYDIPKLAKRMPELASLLSNLEEKEHEKQEAWGAFNDTKKAYSIAERRVSRCRKPESIEKAKIAFEEVIKEYRIKQDTAYRISDEIEELRKAIVNAYEELRERVSEEAREIVRPYEEERNERIRSLEQSLEALQNEGLPRYSTLEGLRFFRTANGEAYGFTVGGKIYIDPRIADAETPVHEYAHLWATALRANNAEEWANVVNLMKGEKELWDEIRKRYPELKTDDEIADEVLAQYSGKRGAERLREEQRKIAQGEGSVFEKAQAVSALERVRKAIEKFWKQVADFLHIHYTSAEQVADQAMKDLLDGVDPTKFGTDSRLRKMGSRTDKRMAEICKHYEGKTLTDEERTVVDVYSGKKDRQAFDITNNDGISIHLEMQQGNEPNAGTKHSIFRHVGKDNGSISYDEIKLIPDVVKTGKRTDKGANVVYQKEIDGVRYTVYTDKKGKKEIFHDFYSNRKTAESESLSGKSTNTQSSARTSDNAVSAANVDITPDMAKEVPTSGEANGTRYSLRHHNRQPGQMDTRAAELYEQMLSGRWSQIDEAWHNDLFICAAM